ncbi:MAG: chromate transporter [Eubacteriales bacterium]|nr:chromate transporter [Eubacteriales bacterium]
MFFQIGLFGFGGGYAMLPLIFQNIQQFGYMGAQEFADLVAISQVTPGPIAVNAATYVGFKTAGYLGAFSATFGVVLPAFTLMIIVSRFIEHFKESAIIKGIFIGVRPVTVGLIASAAVFLGQAALMVPGAGINIIAAGIFGLTILFAGKFKMSPITITIIMGAAGAILCS